MRMSPICLVPACMAVALAASIGPAHAKDKSAAACEIALPSACGESTGTSPMVVTTVDAGSADDCFVRARDAGAECQKRGGASAQDVLARFRRGPAEAKSKPLIPAKRKAVVSLNLPIVYGKDFSAEFDQFGYDPAFTPGQPSVDQARLIVRSGDYLEVRSADGGWKFIDLGDAATAAIRKLAGVGSFVWTASYRTDSSDQAVYVDARGDLYTLLQGGATRFAADKRVNYQPYLLHSGDGGKTWQALAIPVPDDRPSWRATIEHNDANNDRSGPPPVLVFDQDEKPSRSSNLYLVSSAWTNDDLVMRAPVLVSDKSLLTENHSGGSNSLVSTPQRIYVVYPATRAESKMAGTPAYIVSFDRKTGKREREELVSPAGSADRVDNHNIPGICLGKGRSVHVVLPGHQEEMAMRSGNLGDDGRIEWSSEPQRIGERATKAGGYTYASLNCDASGHVVVTTRWSGDDYRFKLALLHRTPAGDWEQWSGRNHLVLVDPGRPYYGAWRQKVAGAADGTLYVFYSYYANHLSSAELAALKKRFPFEDWAIAKEVNPPQCIKGEERRCWIHPMPQVTRVLLRGTRLGESWQFVE